MHEEKEIAVFGSPVLDIFTYFNKCPQLKNIYHFTVIQLGSERIEPSISGIQKYAGVLFDNMDYYVAEWYIKHSKEIERNNIKYAFINRGISFTDVASEDIPVMYMSSNPLRCKDVKLFLDNWLSDSEVYV